MNAEVPVELSPMNLVIIEPAFLGVFEFGEASEPKRLRLQQCHELRKIHVAEQDCIEWNRHVRQTGPS